MKTESLFIALAAGFAAASARCADNAFAASKNPGAEYKGKYRTTWLRLAGENQQKAMSYVEASKEKED